MYTGTAIAVHCCFDNDYEYEDIIYCLWSSNLEDFVKPTENCSQLRKAFRAL